MKREDALPIAQQIIDRLQPACEQISLAGSLRREKPEVKDVEIVLQISDPTSFTRIFNQGIADEFWQMDWETKRNGPLWKRWVVKTGGDWPDLFEGDKNPEQCIAVDVFIADALNWGGTLLIRTGNAQFSKGAMTPRVYPRPQSMPEGEIWVPGLMPEHLRQAEGYLRYKETNEIVPCPTEEEYFKRIFMPWIEPRERTVEALYRLRKFPL